MKLVHKAIFTNPLQCTSMLISKESISEQRIAEASNAGMSYQDKTHSFFAQHIWYNPTSMQLSQLPSIGVEGSVKASMIHRSTRILHVANLLSRSSGCTPSFEACIKAWSTSETHAKVKWNATNSAGEAALSVKIWISRLTMAEISAGTLSCLLPEICLKMLCYDALHHISYSIVSYHLKIYHTLCSTSIYWYYASW